MHAPRVVTAIVLAALTASSAGYAQKPTVPSRTQPDSSGFVTASTYSLLLSTTGHPSLDLTATRATSLDLMATRATSALEVPQSPFLSRTPGAAMVASAVLPGAGQALLGETRWFVYAAVEAWGWLAYLDRRSDARRLERRYKDLAASVARRIAAGERRDTVFEYYEALSHFDASGSFDADLTEAGIQPETDASTFNGDVWRLARALFIPGGGTVSPSSFEYQLALSYYERNAVGPAYAWSWGASRLEQQQYADLIHESDEASRDATLVIGAIVANHLASAIDALVTARLQASAGSSVRFRSRIDLDAAGVRFDWAVRVAR